MSNSKYKKIHSNLKANPRKRTCQRISENDDNIGKDE
jgi:hypothetical protein